MQDAAVISRPLSIGRLREGPESGRASDEDVELAAACARGESPAFERIYREHSARMKSLAFHHLASRGEAEDAVQDTFLKIHRSAGGFQGECAFSSWIYRILINTCYDHLRKRQRRPEETSIGALDPVATPNGEARPEIRLTLRRLVGRLPKLRREVFLLYEVEGFSHREIAAILDLRESYSKWLLHAAKRDLQNMLAEEKRDR